ncbi:unnamed protein product [Adineta steineri]|uniref:DUF229 domain containing protein n=1 Tax=Adineta steineri TaxID=433720 RepID=A0A814VXG7_9BILA|nr:unnamed protein product [Adineta steineri]CAF3945985.1 unnamed protein product [Adineta steineri]
MTMSEILTKLSGRLCFHGFLSISIPVRSRQRIFYLLFSLHVIFFLIVYHRLILITPSSTTNKISANNGKSSSSSSICHIPDLNPWDQTVSKSLNIKPLYVCPKHKKNLINIINHTKLFINQTVNKTYFSGLITHCVYLKVDRNPEEKHFRDWSYTLSEPILIINGRTESILDADFVLTRCYNNRKEYFHGEYFCGYNCSKYKNMSQVQKQILRNRTLVYEYIHPIIRLKKLPFPSKIWSEKISKKLFSPNYSPPSVITVILDAVSNLQAQRALPHTLSYLKSLGLYTFQRHTVVGDGTFENIIPMLFGQLASDLQIPNLNDSRYEFLTTEILIDRKTKNRTEIKKIVHYPGPYDNYSFIIKNFSKLNYTTFFSEEWRDSALYNLKNGFRQSPTDYYLRPYWLSLYETLSYNTFSGNSNPKPCYLDKLLHFLSLDWLKEFLNIYHKTPNYPTFGIMKMNEMSHDYLERLFWIDRDLKTFFQDLIEKNLLNNTILIFCGDHGHRQHRLRLTRIGSFEVKLPFFSILLPKSFEKNFPQAIANLKNNQKTLTSWWDVYETFVNILKMVEQPHLLDPLRVKWQPTTSGISLFHPIPERNCSSAGIPDKYCPCSLTIPLDIELPIIKELAIYSINYINNIKLKNHKHLCMPLELKTIIRAELEELNVPIKIPNDTIKSNFTHLYTVLFEVSPSDGIFESRFLYDSAMKRIRLHSGILRINLYGQTSACIQDKYDLRSFCYCISYYRRLKNNSQNNNNSSKSIPITTTKIKTKS